MSLVGPSPSQYPPSDPARDLQLLRAALRVRAARLLLGTLLLAAGACRPLPRTARDAVAPVPLRLGETGYSTAIPYDVLRRSSLAVRAGGGTGVLPPLACARGSPNRPASDCAVDPVRLRAGGDPGQRPRRPGQRAGVPLRPLPRLWRGEARGHRAAKDLLRRPSRRLQRRLRGCRARRRRSHGTRAVADPEGVECDVRARKQIARTGRASARSTGPSSPGQDPKPPCDRSADPAGHQGDQSTVTAFAGAGARCARCASASPGSRPSGALSAACSPSRSRPRGWRRLRAQGRPLRRRLRRHLSARRTHCRTSVVRRRLVLVRTRKERAPRSSRGRGSRLKAAR